MTVRNGQKPSKTSYLFFYAVRIAAGRKKYINGQYKKTNNIMFLQVMLVHVRDLETFKLEKTKMEKISKTKTYS